MKKKLVFYRDKKEKFNCNLHIDGANISNSKIRLCLECKNGLNYFLNGIINRDGSCNINIPPLKNLEQGDEGNAIVEVIVDNNYFKVYESMYEIKNSVNVTFEFKDNSEYTEPIVEDDKPKITFNVIENDYEKLEEKNEQNTDSTLKDKNEEIINESEETPDIQENEEILIEENKDEQIIEEVEEEVQQNDNRFIFSNFLKTIK